MMRVTCALLFAILALSIIDPTAARRSLSRHSYPSSRGGLSGGGGSHSYPSSGGLSGHGSHGYPSSGGGLSGGGNRGYPSSGQSGGSHGYPSSGGSNGYPSSGGLSGNGGGGRGYPSNTNTHPTNTHSYPATSGLSGSGSQSKPGHTTTTNVHHHYHYSPPQQIQYAPRGGPPVSYPVYHGTPPGYVYQYKDSGSKYSSLLAGLALFNLGALGGYALGHHNSGSGGGSSGTYKHQPGEVCKFGIRKENGDYEETRIDCQLISSFIIAEEAKQNAQNNNSTVTTITISTTNVTTINNTNEASVVAAASTAAAAPADVLSMFPNGTLVSANETAINGTILSGNEKSVLNATADVTNAATNDSQAAANAVTSSMTVTTTTTNTTVTNALDVKGPPVQVTDGMKCYVIRNTQLSTMRKSVPCGLLQTYSERSLKKNSATKIAPTLSIFTVIVVLLTQY